MREVTAGQVIEVLAALGVQPGDCLLVHSAVQFLGRPAGGVGTYLEALQAVIGPEGTLAVPAFNFGFAHGEPYDPQTTPAQGMGVFSEWVRQHPQAQRTLHPMQSLAAIGPEAAGLARRDTPSAFDPGSAFEHLLDMDAKLLLLGAGVNAVSMLHYSEQHLSVPYRYWKSFTGPVRTPDGWQQRTYRMFVRYLEIDPRLDLGSVEATLKARGLWQDRPLNYGRLSVCRLADFVAVVDEFLSADPWSLVTNREQALLGYQRILPQ